MNLKVIEILQHFLNHADWVDPANTVDHVIIGDPEKRIDRCLVTWMPGMAALRYAASQGYELVICHEPTFWNHPDDNPETNPHSADKVRFIRDHNITILRNHDCWDRWPEIGIPWAWAQFLGLETPPTVFGGENYQHRYELDPVPLGEFALRIAEKCASLGEPAVQVTGNLEKPVSKIGIGTGCGCDIETFIQMGCDCSVVCDDGSVYWANIQMAADLGHPVIRVNHGTSEEPGMVTLTRYINDTLPITAEHFPHGSSFQLVNSKQPRP